MKSKLLNFKMVSRLLMVLVGTIVLSSCNHTQGVGGVAKSPDQLKTELMKEVPGITKIDAINPSPVSGIYEVIVGRQVFYTTADGKYLFFGNLIDPVSKKSLTEERKQELSKVDWSKLPLNLAIKEVNGTGERKIAVFSDPDCPYCQMFEKQVAPLLTNTTIYTFLFPLSIHPHAKDDVASIWCSKDRTKTWTNWMRNKIALPVGATCDTSDLDKVYKIGTDVVQVEGTPTVILSNGQILPGMLPPDQLMAQMDEAAGKKAPATK